jgi:hypothetical protein
MIRIRGVRWVAGFAAIAGCSSGAPLASTGGSVSVAITSATADSSGYTLSLQVTNSDTGSIALNPYCPGTIEVRTGSAWAPAGDDPICPAPAVTVAPGQMRAFTLPNQGVIGGQVIRYVLQWSWFNGDGTAGGHATSGATTLR